MRYIAITFAFAVALLPGLTHALDLSAYQRSDGAITVHPLGDRVDPYFAIKALWAARQLGDPAVRETRAWINWLLPRQAVDGSFSRYCLQGTVWQPCETADADDSLLAMWIELLHEAAPHKMPLSWIKSERLAADALERLHDRDTGVYRVSSKISDALLMDNVEVYAMLSRVAELQGQAGNPAAKRHLLIKARLLRFSMSKVFNKNGKSMLRWTSGDATKETFYPNRVAHLYPWLHRMNTEAFGPILSWTDWLNQFGEEWLTRTGDSYPWGLVALLAYRQGSYSIVNRWLDNGVALRGGAYWNILEEALLQGLASVRLNSTWR